MKSEQNELEKWKKAEKEAQEKIDEDARHLEKYASKMNLVEQKIAECLSKISQLGALPAQDLYSHYNKLSVRTVSYIYKYLTILFYNRFFFSYLKSWKKLTPS